MKKKILIYFASIFMFYSCGNDDSADNLGVQCNCFQIEVENGVIISKSGETTKLGASCNGLQKIDLATITEGENVSGKFDICSVK